MLKGARLVSASETEEGRAWAESRIKQLTGGDPISARFMRQDFFTFEPQFKLLIVGNHAPVLRNVDEAARRRFNIIPFTHRPVSPDRHLEVKLAGEHGRILQWMIDGCLDWQANGLIRPEVVRAATDDYFDEQDVFGQWLAERCLTSGGKFEAASHLYADWQKFSEEHGEDPGSARQFGGLMAKRGMRARNMRTYGQVQRTYQDIGLTPKDPFDVD
jgi:putative DNA primase/helicase